MKKVCLGLLFLTLSVAAIAHSDTDKAAVTKALMPSVQKACAFPVKITPRIFNLKSGWCFTVCRITAVNPKNQGDGEAMGLLHKVGAKWKVVEWTVGSDIQRIYGVAPIGIAPPDKDLASSRISGATSSHSQQNSLPVRPSPVWISSTISRQS